MVMKLSLILRMGQVCAVASVAAMALVSGCGKQESTADGHGNDHSGHRHGAAAKPEPAAAKCTKHQAPKELCFICDPALRNKSRLWCQEHNRYEDRCWECHPEARNKNRLFCDEHGLYEDECFICHPEVKPKPKAEAPGSPQSSALMCAEHGVPEAECGICHPDLAAKLKPGEGMKVRLPSTNSVSIAGVQTAVPTVGAITENVDCYAEIAFNQNKLAQIAAPVGGIIQEVTADLGGKVAEGQTLAKIWSAGIAEAVAKAVLTHQVLDRERRLWTTRVTSERNLQQAEAEHRAACQQLRTFGFTEEQIDALSIKPQESVLLEVRAPFAGEIIERTAVRGALVEAGKALFTIADRSTMWAMLNIPEPALSRVRPGQAVELTVDSLPDRTFAGKLTWIGAEVDERSRMARARAEFSNPDGLLKSRMFAQARIITRGKEGALLLPPGAIQRVDGKPFVFVKLADDLFEARAIRLGVKLNGRQEVLAGLKPEEQIAVNHAFAIKSAMLMSRLGAGCADD
jgi:membrane fusion protein, heavy metal efflux system